jgi:hypothetical protein
MMFVYACYGAAVVGHWPYYAHPDPKELPHRTLLHVAAIVMLIGALSVLLVPVGHVVWRLVQRLRHSEVREHRRWLLLYVVGMVIWILDCVSMFSRGPWHSIISWIVD